jgi:phosphoglycolate phosphatase
MSAGRRAVLFDLDGTLTDSGPGILRSVRHAMERLGLAAVDGATLRAFVGPPLLESFRHTWSLDEETARAAVAAYREYYADRGLRETLLYPGIAELLRGLHEGGHTMLVATSKPTPFAERVLGHVGVRERFHAVVGSHLDHTRTDKSEVVAAALSLLEPAHRPGAVMVGDRQHDVRAARRHGLYALAVSYGYADPGELEAATPDALVHTVEELGLRLQA